MKLGETGRSILCRGFIRSWYYLVHCRRQFALRDYLHGNGRAIRIHPAIIQEVGYKGCNSLRELVVKGEISNLVALCEPLNDSVKLQLSVFTVVIQSQLS